MLIKRLNCKFVRLALLPIERLHEVQATDQNVDRAPASLRTPTHFPYSADRGRVHRGLSHGSSVQVYPFLMITQAGAERLAEAGVEPSVGSVGDSYDNALAETINGLYKAEVIHRRGPWRSFEAVEFATLEWVDWFNNRRLLEPIGNIPPAEAEERYYAMLEQPAMAA